MKKTLINPALTGQNDRFTAGWVEVIAPPLQLAEIGRHPIGPLPSAS